MARRFIFVVIAGALLAPVCTAQVRGGFHGSARGVRGFGGSLGGHHREAFTRGYFVGETPFLYDDYPFGPALPEPAPQFFVTQSPAAADAPSVKTASLLIELHGDRYVRFGGSARSTEAAGPEREVSVLATTSSPITPPHLAPPDLPPTVLVYRDGHREEVADYAIVGSVIYAHRTHDEQIGYELNSIQVSALDIPATVRVNREAGVSFALPAGPNEVVTRP